MDLKNSARRSWNSFFEQGDKVHTFSEADADALEEMQGEEAFSPAADQVFSAAPSFLT